MIDRPSDNYRIGAVAALAGGVLALVANIVHPQLPDDKTASVRAVADSGVWVIDHLTLFVASLLVVGGLVTIARSLQPVHEAAARLSTIAAVVGGGVAATSLGMETFTAKTVANRYVDEGSEAALFAALAVRDLERGLFATWLTILLGVVPVLIGWGMFASDQYRTSLAVGGVTAGVLNFVVGSAILVGAEGTVVDVALTLSSLAGTVWLLFAGWSLWGFSGDRDYTLSRGA